MSAIRDFWRWTLWPLSGIRHEYFCACGRYIGHGLAAWWHLRLHRSHVAAGITPDTVRRTP